MATILKVRPPPPGSPAAPTPFVVNERGSLIGRRIGSYTVLEELGQGGMGCVYLAEHALIGRKAAIKVLNADIASDPEVVSRFFAEARAANDIRHPNIVEVTDFGLFGSSYCIIMEFLEGETLAARQCRVRTFDEPSVVGIMKQCTSALAAAHEQGLVHRDIKPENIFLRAHPDYPDFVKLLDFGIAKLLGSEATVGHHTKTGSVLGTPSYMSPEQCLGEAALDIRSDVYSLGVVMYQMLTGVLPFTGDTFGRLVVCHVNEAPVPPTVVNAAVSRPMNDLVLRALQKNPKDRYQSARDMREALERVLAPPARTETTIPSTIYDLPSGPARVGLAADATNQLTAIVVDRLARGQVELPELPGPTARCLELARNGRLGFADAATIINDLPALRSRVMRLANSAAFPSKMPATTLTMAIGRLGTEGLHNALIEFAARDALEGPPARVRDTMRRIWPHALGTAVMTAELCRLHGRTSQAANGYLSGLLAQVGKPLVATLLLDIEQQIQRSGQPRGPLPETTFRAVVEGAAAPTAGGATARHWGLPGAVAEAIEGSGGWRAREPHVLSNLVRFAGLLTGRLGLTVGLYNGPEAERAFGEGRALLRTDESALRRLTHGFKERMSVLAGIRG